MPHDIDWNMAANDFHPDFAHLAQAGLIAPVSRKKLPSGAYMSVFNIARSWLPHGVAVFTSVIFIDSLRYKFTDHPKTQEIFIHRLDGWASSLGAPGLFGHTGIFSQYVIGAAELFASFLMLFGMFVGRYRFLQPVGALIGLAVMTGAISFHLFTPLGVDPNLDGGGLFVAACSVWTGCLAMLCFRTKQLGILGGKLAAFFSPVAA
jgi:hypothetical protein